MRPELRVLQNTQNEEKNSEAHPLAIHNTCSHSAQQLFIICCVTDLYVR